MRRRCWGWRHMIMALGLKLRLRVLIPAVENVISGNALKPKDILTSRKGLTVEVNDTDAEGRLVLADALALADEEKPDSDRLDGHAHRCRACGGGARPRALSIATMRGFAGALAKAAAQVADPVWRHALLDAL